MFKGTILVQYWYILKSTLTSLSACWCCSRCFCLATARSQSFCHWLTSWLSSGVWGSRCSRGTGTAGCSLRVLLLSGWTNMEFRKSARATNFCFTHQWHYYNNDFYFALFSYGGLLVRGRLLGETCCLEMLLCLQDFVACSTSGNFLFISSMNTCGEE